MPMTSDTATLEAPVVPKPKRTLTPERIALMQAGRKKKQHKPSAVLAAPVVDDAKDCEIALLKSMLAAASTPKTVDVSTLPTHECYFEFRRNPKVEMERITSFADPRWDEFRDSAKWAHPAHGSFVVNVLTRNAAGDVVARVHETVNQGIWGPAREAMGRHERTGKHYIESNPVKA